MTKVYRTISIVFIILLAAITISMEVFCFTQNLWIKSVKVQLSDTQKMIEGGNFTEVEAGLALSGIFPSDKQNREKLYEQKAIIAAHSGDVDLSRKYFEEAGEGLSEVGEYYSCLVREIREISRLGNWEAGDGAKELRIKNYELRGVDSGLLNRYQSLDEYQWGSPYRELLLSQILVELGEPRMAEYALNQAIKKDPGFRDAYVMLLSISNDNEWIEEKIKEIDPDFDF